MRLNVYIPTMLMTKYLSAQSRHILEGIWLFEVVHYVEICKTYIQYFKTKMLNIRHGYAGLSELRMLP